MCTYIYAHVYVVAYVYVHVHVRPYCMLCDTCICVYISTYTHTCKYRCIYMYRCTHTYMYVYIYTHLYSCISIFTQGLRRYPHYLVRIESFQLLNSSHAHAIFLKVTCASCIASTTSYVKTQEYGPLPWDPLGVPFAKRHGRNSGANQELGLTNFAWDYDCLLKAYHHAP